VFIYGSGQPYQMVLRYVKKEEESMEQTAVLILLSASCPLSTLSYDKIQKQENVQGIVRMCMCVCVYVCVCACVCARACTTNIYRHT
jgi:hypothetical protein